MLNRIWIIIIRIKAKNIIVLQNGKVYECMIHDIRKHGNIFWNSLLWYQPNYQSTIDKTLLHSMLDTYYLIFYKLSNFLQDIFSLASIPVLYDGLNTKFYKNNNRNGFNPCNYNGSFQTMRFLRLSLLLILFISTDFKISRAGENLKTVIYISLKSCYQPWALRAF